MKLAFSVCYTTCPVQLYRGMRKSTEHQKIDFFGWFCMSISTEEKLGKTENAVPK